jgi:hypothetical protein
MAGNKEVASINNSSRILTALWFLLSAGLAYPFFNLLISFGFNQALAVTVVFVCICLLYDIPYRAKTKAEHHTAMIRADQWRNRLN